MPRHFTLIEMAMLRTESNIGPSQSHPTRLFFLKEINGLTSTTMLKKEKAAITAEDVDELRETLLEMLAVAEGTGTPKFNSPIVLKSGERLIYAITGAGLFEVRRRPGVDGTAAAAPTILDHGRVAITSQGVTFLGAKCTREWPFAKLIRVKHFDDRPWTGIQVTTRERMSGFTYRGLRPEFVRSRMTLAVAIQRGQRDRVAGELRDLLDEVERRGITPLEQADTHVPVRMPPQRSVAAINEGRPKRQKPLILAARAVEKGA
jgi:hypothetical protein